jgi:hypothetical protein
MQGSLPFYETSLNSIFIILRRRDVITFSCNSKCMFILTSFTVFHNFVPFRVPFGENKCSKKIGNLRITTLFRIITEIVSTLFCETLSDQNFVGNPLNSI